MSQQSEMLAQVAQHNNNAQAKAEGLPVGHNQQTVIEPQVEPQIEPTPQPLPISAEAEEVSENWVEVDGQKFTDEKAAFKYLQGRYGEVQTERMLDAARLEGMQEALQHLPVHSSPQPAPQLQPEDDIDLDKYYEDPAGYLKEYGKRIKDSLKNELTQSQLAAQREQQIWNTFSSRYKDLADFREDVDRITDKYRDTVVALAKKDPDRAMEFVATKTREKFHQYIEANKPTRVLDNVRGGVSAGSNYSVTNNKNNNPAQNPVDFVSQLRTMRR